MLKLMYITNSPEVASIADGAGVDRIFIDLEQYGKEKRQKNWDSVKSKPTRFLTAFLMNSKAFSPASPMLSCCRISKPSARSRLL